MGTHPDPYTLAQLTTMTRGRAKAEWSRTSAVLAMLANANRNPKKRPYPFEPDDFNPFAEYRGPRGLPFDKETSRLLAQAMTGKTLEPEHPTRWQLLAATT